MNDFPTVLQGILDFYHQQACPCAFPRFRQWAAIDCTDTGDAYAMYETEVLIGLARPGYDTTPQAGTWRCLTCESEFAYEWQDFSIHVNRQTLKPVVLKCMDVGADAESILPFVVGPSGHSLPDKAGYRQVDAEAFRTYMCALAVPGDQPAHHNPLYSTL